MTVATSRLAIRPSSVSARRATGYARATCIIGVLELPVMVSVFNFYYRPVIWLYESTQLDELRTMA